MCLKPIHSHRIDLQLGLYLANAAVLCLPCEKVEQRAQRLTYKTETDPENRISNDSASWIVPFLQWKGDRNERQLEHHTCKCDA